MGESLLSPKEAALKNRFFSKYFNERWYGWQNPDSHNYKGTVFDHYWGIGSKELRDPSPMVDATRYRNTIGADIKPGLYNQAILLGLTGRAYGVYDGWSDLELSQKEFHSSLKTCTHRVRDYSRNKCLVYVQAGPGSLHKKWFSKPVAKFDLMLNYYDTSELDLQSADYVFSQKGTKFTAIGRLYHEFKEVFDRYEYVFFLDDDIYIDTDDINVLFEKCKENSLSAAQPSLSAESHCIWDVFYRKASGIRYVNGVEIMMPVLSRSALQKYGDLFMHSVSGFGLDLLIGKMVSEDGGHMAVVDDIQAIHAKPIDDKGGAYYEYMRSNLINPKAELWQLVTKYDLEINFREVA